MKNNMKIGEIRKFKGQKYRATVDFNTAELGLALFTRKDLELVLLLLKF